MGVKEIKRRKSRLKKYENRYVVWHITKGFVGYVNAINIAVVRKRYPEDRGYSVYRRKRVVATTPVRR